MSVGGWQEKFDFAFPPDVVFAHLVAVLGDAGCTVETADPARRGVVAYRGDVFAFSFVGTARVAAAVDAVGSGAARVIIESAPAYQPMLLAHHWHRGHIRRLMTALKQSLDA